MAELMTNPDRMAELYDHLVRMESAIPYLYCDNVGLVTVAIGFLVDQRGAADSVGEGQARTLANRNDVTFTLNGAAVGANDVVNDWKRVKAYGRAHPGVGAGSYRTVAQLRISNQTMRNLTYGRVTDFANTLYSRRPFIREHDPYVAMALLDARYNPAGVALYTAQNPDIPRMWNALNPYHRDFDPNRAVELFESIWANKTNVAARYIQRHFLRVQWMRQGFEEMGLMV